MTFELIYQKKSLSIHKMLLKRRIIFKKFFKKLFEKFFKKFFKASKWIKDSRLNFELHMITNFSRTYKSGLSQIKSFIK